MVGVLRGFLSVVAVAACAGVAEARETVRVGGYQFPPYVEVDSRSSAVSGLTIEMIELLNASQDAFRFEFVLTTPTRRYQDFEAQRFDVVLFEMPEWGWSSRSLPVEASAEIGVDGEVYIALAADDRDQTFFDDIASRRIAAILGYNYGFAGFRNDPVVLRDEFEIALVNDNTATIELVIRQRVDIGVVTQSFLNRHLAAHPEQADRLLISERYDQVYSLRVLAREGMEPSAAAIGAMLADLAADGRLETLMQKHGLAR